MNKRLQLLILLGLMILIIVLIVFNQDRLMAMLQKTSDGTDLEEVWNIPITRDATADMEDVALNDAIYYTERGRLYAQSLNNEPLWDIALPGEISLKANSNRILAVDESVGNIYLLDLTGQPVASLLGLGQIDSFQLLESNQIVIVPTSNKEIRLYDETLKLMSTLAIPSGTVLSYHVSLEYDRLAVLTLEDADGALQTSIVLYNLKGGALQIINRDEIAIAAYTYRDEIFVVIPSGVVVYKEMLRRPVQYEELNNVRSTAFFDDILYMETGSANSIAGEIFLTAYSFKDREVQFDKQLTNNYDKIVAQGNQILTYSKNRLIIQTMGGELVLDKTYPVPIRKADILPDGRILLVFADRITLNLLKH